MDDTVDGGARSAIACCSCPCETSGIETLEAGAQATISMDNLTVCMQVVVIHPSVCHHHISLAQRLKSTYDDAEAVASRDGRVVMTIMYSLPEHT
jgi:hypothetical protein